MHPAVVMPLDADEEEVTFSSAVDTTPPQPYLQYAPDDLGGGGEKGVGLGTGDGGGGGGPSGLDTQGMVEKLYNIIFIIELSPCCCCCHCYHLSLCFYFKGYLAYIPILRTGYCSLRDKRRSPTVQI